MAKVYTLNITKHKENANEDHNHLIPIGIAAVRERERGREKGKKEGNDKCWLGCREIGTLVH